MNINMNKFDYLHISLTQNDGRDTRIYVVDVDV